MSKSTTAKTPARKTPASKTSADKAADEKVAQERAAAEAKAAEDKAAEERAAAEAKAAEDKAAEERAAAEAKAAEDKAAEERAAAEAKAAEDKAAEERAAAEAKANADAASVPRHSDEARLEHMIEEQVRDVITSAKALAEDGDRAGALLHLASERRSAQMMGRACVQVDAALAAAEIEMSRSVTCWPLEVIRYDGAERLPGEPIVVTPAEFAELAGSGLVSDTAPPAPPPTEESTDGLDV